MGTLFALPLVLHQCDLFSFREQQIATVTAKQKNARMPTGLPPRTQPTHLASTPTSSHQSLALSQTRQDEVTFRERMESTENKLASQVVSDEGARCG